MAVAGEEHVVTRIVTIVPHDEVMFVSSIDDHQFPAGKRPIFDQQFLDLQGADNWEPCLSIPVISRGYNRRTFIIFKKRVPRFDRTDIKEE
jgi:hypothetical protein